jgi:hypothetical protein
MEYYWMAAGAIIGWIGIEFLIAAIGKRCPTSFNVCMAFVGGLTGYTLFL